MVTRQATAGTAHRRNWRDSPPPSHRRIFFFFYWFSGVFCMPSSKGTCQCQLLCLCRWLHAVNYTVWIIAIQRDCNPKRCAEISAIVILPQVKPYPLITHCQLNHFLFIKLLLCVWFTTFENKTILRAIVLCIRFKTFPNLSTVELIFARIRIKTTPYSQDNELKT